jgi:AAA domain
MIRQATRSSKGIETNKIFVVVSGLPGSGKSTLARRLAPLLNLPVIDKDDILESLFEAKGAGDAKWRRALSRESDKLLQVEAFKAEGAILVSFWHLPGMASDSGTPTEWLRELSNRMFNVHCICGPEIAAERCFRRKRHPGHLDGAASKEDVLASILAISHLDPLEIGHRIEVDTSQGQPEWDAIVNEILKRS